MNFDPEVIISSKLPGYEDVSFTIHQLTEGKRLKVRTVLADVNAQLRDLMTEKVTADGLPEAERAPLYARIGLSIQELLEDKITPAWVRALLVSIDGLTIKGQPATAESLIESGPRELYYEIGKAVRAAAGMTDEERGESVPPTTSSALADGRINNTSAPIAEDVASI